MWIKTVCVLLATAQTRCTGADNGSSDAAGADGKFSSLNLTLTNTSTASGRSFAAKRISSTQTDEPIDYPEPPDGNFSNRSNATRTEETDAAPRLCQNIDPDVVRCNRSEMFPEMFEVSPEAVEFLTGRVVTRLMPSFYILLFLVSFPLNAAAFLTFSWRIAGKKPAVIYMSQLACVDLLFTLLLPLKIHYQLRASDWRLGEAACRVLSAAYYCYTYCSVLLVTCMSVDRLVGVALPVASLSWRSARRTCCVCALVWLLASAGTAPLLFITQTYRIRGVGLTCHDVLVYSSHAQQQYVYVFSILSAVFYFLPLVVTFVSYCVIIYVLSSKPHSLAASSSSSFVSKRRRAVMMAVCVLMEFVVCFAPSHVLLLRHCVRLAVGGAGGGDWSYSQYVMAACAGSASVVLDPLLYYYGSSQCRQQIRSWWRKAKNNLSSSSSRRGTSYSACDYSQARVRM